MTKTVRHDDPPAFTPESDRRRGRLVVWLTKDISPRDLMLFLVAALAAFGFVNPFHRITVLETRVNGLEEQQRFTNYMLCSMSRRVDPAGAPPECMPIIERKGK